jgi:pentapeptide MXKDX repeat protein
MVEAGEINECSRAEEELHTCRGWGPSIRDCFKVIINFIACAKFLDNPYEKEHLTLINVNVKKSSDETHCVDIDDKTRYDGHTNKHKITDMENANSVSDNNEFYNKQHVIKTINDDPITASIESHRSDDLNHISHINIIGSSASNGEGYNKDAINKDAINKDAINKDAINKDAINKDAINKDAINNESGDNASRSNLTQMTFAQFIANDNTNDNTNGVVGPDVMVDVGPNIYPNIYADIDADIDSYIGANDNSNDKSNDKSNDNSNDKSNDNSNDNSNDKSNDNSNDEKEVIDIEIIKSNLRVIASIQLGEKLCEDHLGGLSVDNSYVPSIMRALVGNSRDNTISQVVKTIEIAKIIDNVEVVELIDDRVIEGLKNLIATYSNSPEVSESLGSLSLFKRI